MSAAPSRAPAGPVVVVAEHSPDRLAPLSLELLACGRLVAGILGRPLRLVVLGQAPEPVAREAAETHGVDVTALIIAGLKDFHGEAYGQALGELLPAWQAPVVLAPHTTGGLDWAPGLATRWGAACATGVEGVEPRGEGLRLSRAGLFGKAMEQLAPEVWPLVLTVQPGAFPTAAQGPGSAGAVELISLPAPALRTRIRETRPGAGADAALNNAQVVVAAGRGIGKKENLGLLRRLTGLFSGAALAGSRPVCDLGWLDYRSQVGLTGATVAPRLYLACGISGARQHTVGMQGAGFIVAVNSDPQAAIFDLADVCLVEDLLAFIPALLEVAAESSGD